MTIYYVNTGTSPNSGGDSLRVAFTKINQNFVEVEQQFSNIIQGSTSSLSNGEYFLAVQADGTVVHHTNNQSYQNGNQTIFNINAHPNQGSIDTFPGMDFSINTNLNDHTWTFTYDGKLVFPDGSIQTTAGGTATVGNQLTSGTSAVILVEDGTLTIPGNVVPASTSTDTFFGTSDHFLKLEQTGALVLQSRYNSGMPIVLAAGSSDAMWAFDANGTITTPYILPASFTAVCDTEHMVDAVGFASDDPWWEFDVEFQVNPDGTVETMVNNIFPIIANPGYVSGYTFEFTEDDHGIPGYTFTITLNDVYYPGGAGWTSNIACSPPPAFPSTIASEAAIKITSNGNDLVLGTLGNLTTPGNVIPALDNEYDLGSPTSQWRSLYVSTSTIYMGGVPISLTANGSLSVNGDTLITDQTVPQDISQLTDATGLLDRPTNTGYIRFINDIIYADQGNTITLAPSLKGDKKVNPWIFSSSGALTFPSGLIIDASTIGYSSSETITEEIPGGVVSQTTTDQSQIEIDADNITIARRAIQVANDGVTTATDIVGSILEVTGQGVGIKRYVEPDGPQNGSYFQVKTSNNGAIMEGVVEDLNGDTYGRVVAAQGVVEISAGAAGIQGNSWAFTNEGDFLLPQGSMIKNRADNNTTIELIPNEMLYGSGQYLRIYPTNVYDVPHIHIAAGSGGDLIWGDDLTNVDVNSDGSVRVNTYGNQWIFDTNGEMTLPVGGDIKDSNGNSVLVTGDNNYTPSEPTNWEGSPTVTTIQSALDELAARVSALQIYEIDGGYASTDYTAELTVDGGEA